MTLSSPFSKSVCANHKWDFFWFQNVFEQSCQRCFNFQHISLFWHEVQHSQGVLLWVFNVCNIVFLPTLKLNFVTICPILIAISSLYTFWWMISVVSFSKLKNGVNKICTMLKLMSVWLFAFYKFTLSACSSKSLRKQFWAFAISHFV